ncbi:MAG: hypothetical protein U9R15_04935, partial [Chloroflexota bacterium]|nr:hypothetical protein [Chloroflexota bacterium]
QPTAAEGGKTETATLTPVTTPTPSNTPRKPEATMTPLATPASACALGIRAAVDLVVMGLGLLLLVIGLVLIWRRRARSPKS